MERVGYARHRNPPKRGDLVAYPTSRDDTGFDSVRATVLKKRLPTRPSACGGLNPRAGQEDRSLRPTSDGLGGRTALLPLPSGAQSCHLVEPRGEPFAAGIACRSLCARRTVGVGRR